MSRRTDGPRAPPRRGGISPCSWSRSSGWRTRTALGVQAGAQALGLALGPTVGGLPVSTFGWRWVFGINVPVRVVAVVAGVYLLPRSRSRHPTQGWDRSGLLLLGTAITAALLGLPAVAGLGLPTWATVGDRLVPTRWTDHALATERDAVCRRRRPTDCHYPIGGIHWDLHRSSTGASRLSRP